MKLPIICTHYDSVSVTLINNYLVFRYLYDSIASLDSFYVDQSLKMHQKVKVKCF